jgi:antitoxin (DNA-binding transcriptional repressor) of toxin-antitoxin stability system
LKEISATEAARRFSEVLDAVEHEHRTFVVRRGGKVVASIGPATQGSGRTLKAVLGRHRPDPGWATELAELRHGLTIEDRSWPA